MIRTDVLIVGGGPTGTALATLLQRWGVTCDVVEARTAIDPRSKALSVNSATSELFDDLGIGPAFRELALPNDLVHIWWNHREIHRVRLDDVPSEHPGFAMLPQFETERLMRANLTEAGGRILTGTRLTALEDCGDSASSDGVVCTFQDEHGRVRRQRYRYVVGCDGPRSAVRTLTGIDFPGADYDMHFAMCDARVRWDGMSGSWHYFVLDGGFMILIPLSDELHRVVIQYPGKLDPTKEYTRDDFVEWAGSMGLEGFELGELTWVSSARFYSRIADRFRRGPIFLAGDAAHLFSPIGGQGMNTGLQDALALAWRLAAVIRGRATEALLDGYELERREFARQTCHATDGMTQAIALLDRSTDGPLADFLPSKSSTEFLAKILPQRLSGTLLAYSPPAHTDLKAPASFLAGKRARSNPGRGCFSLRHDIESALLVLYCCYGEHPSHSTRRAVRRIASEYQDLIALREVAVRSDGLPHRLEAGGETLSVEGSWFALVRPDRIVDLAGRCAARSDVENLLRHLREWYGSRGLDKSVSGPGDVAVA